MRTRQLASVLVLAFATLLASEASAQGRAARTTPNRDGMFLQGGGWFTEGGYYNRPWFRAEVGLHLRRLRRADLYLQIPAMITHDRWDYPGSTDSYSWLGLVLAPGVRGEWTLYNGKGDVAVFLEGGAGLQMFSWNWDFRDSGGGQTSETWIYGILRTGAGAVYTAPFGLMITAQVAGFAFNIGGSHGHCGSGVCYSYGGSRGGYYDASLMIGYRWE